MDKAYSIAATIARTMYALFLYAHNLYAILNLMQLPVKLD